MESKLVSVFLFFFITTFLDVRGQNVQKAVVSIFIESITYMLLCIAQNVTLMVSYNASLFATLWKLNLILSSHLLLKVNQSKLTSQATKAEIYQARIRITVFSPLI